MTVGLDDGSAYCHTEKEVADKYFLRKKLQIFSEKYVADIFLVTHQVTVRSRPAIQS